MTNGSFSDRNGGLSPSLIVPSYRPRLAPDDMPFEHCLPFRDKDVLHQKYVVEGLSLRQIAADFLSSKEAVRKGLIDFGIPLRTQHQPHGRQSQPRYGQHRHNGKVEDVKHKKNIIASVRQMWEQGLSLRQIAKNLTAMGIPTKLVGRKWRPEMIRRLINQND